MHHLRRPLLFKQNASTTEVTLLSFFEDWLWSAIDWLFKHLGAVFGGFALGVLFMLLIALLRPENLDYFVAEISRFFAWCSDRLERRYIGKSIKAGLNAQIRELNKEVPGLSLRPVDIKWVESREVYAQLKKGKIIIFMKNYHEQPKNLAIAASVYVPKALLPRVRRYVDPDLMEAIDYVIAKKLVSHSPGAIGYLVEIYSERFERKPRIKELVTLVDDIEASGYLTRIILREFRDSFIGAYPREPNAEMWKESVDFVIRAHELLAKPPEERRYLDIPQGRWIRAAIVPIARSETVMVRGIDPHIAFVKKCINRGICDFFIVAAGWVNIQLAKMVVDELKSLGLVEITRDEYRGFYRDIPRMRLFCAFLRWLPNR